MIVYANADTKTCRDDQLFVMGISDLVAWVKKVHPSVIKAFPRRWADPAIKGKKVAIDATLLTNRFHFAQGEVVPDKQALIRWYQ